MARAEEAQALRHFGVDAYWHSVRGAAIALGTTLSLILALELAELTHLARTGPTTWSARTFGAGLVVVIVYAVTYIGCCTALDLLFGSRPNRAWAVAILLTAVAIAAPLCSVVPALAAAPLRQSARITLGALLALACVALLGTETLLRAGRNPDPLQLAGIGARSVGTSLLLSAAGLLVSIATISRKSH